MKQRGEKIIYEKLRINGEGEGENKIKGSKNRVKEINAIMYMLIYLHYQFFCVRPSQYLLTLLILIAEWHCYNVHASLFALSNF